VNLDNRLIFFFNKRQLIITKIDYEMYDYEKRLWRSIFA